MEKRQMNKINKTNKYMREKFAFQNIISQQILFWKKERKEMSSNVQTAIGRKKLQNYSYNLDSHIGKGYSSHVYKGKNDLSNQTVAIKVIDMKMIKGQVHKNLLTSQIDVLKTLKSLPNILQLFDIYTTKNNTYIITELCDEGDLAKLISQRKTIPESQAMELMGQVINGYNQVAKNGIIHRDLKPANIFMSHHQVKIADFGFAMKNTDSKKYSSYNVGSPIYMPPEALNENKYSFKSDIWALGVIYYEMLTGKTPWRAKTQKQLGKQLLTVTIQKLIPKNLCHASIEFLKKTLTINVNDRMSPQQLKRFSFSQQKSDKQSTKADESSNKSIPQTGVHFFRSKDHETSLLTRNTITTPKNITRFNFVKNACDSIGQQKEKQNKIPSTSKQNHVEAGKTKTQFFTSSTSKNNLHTTTQFSSTQKELGNYRSTTNITVVDKKVLSKHLLSQIHFCRFIYKLLMRIDGKLSQEINIDFSVMKEMMSGLLFQKLDDLEGFKLLSAIEKKEYKDSADGTKIVQIINQYQGKYKRDLRQINKKQCTIEEFRKQLNQQIISLHSFVSGKVGSEVKEEVIVLDYMVTLRQLLLILEENDLQNFHIKSKMEQIVEGTPAQNITTEHIAAISNKLKVLKII